VREAESAERMLVPGQPGRVATEPIVREANAIMEVEQGDLTLRTHAPHELEARKFASPGLAAVAGSERGPASVADNSSEGDRRKWHVAGIGNTRAVGSMLPTLPLHIPHEAKGRVQAVHRQEAIGERCADAVMVARHEWQAYGIGSGLDHAANVRGGAPTGHYNCARGAMCSSVSLSSFAHIGGDGEI